MENSKDKYIFKCNIFKPTSNLTYSTPTVNNPL